ncbi:cartilage oligomeric matrix protein-like [Penaeus monodon]|uniref:cartilage oligomeric matrix protein-like n=1 Tax=Penaeus monodon TaxID=6687 RepID=UPI0018A7A3BD|nr:cartilage oligomeric matrix protein-like [Penaeus monodon]
MMKFRYACPEGYIWYTENPGVGRCVEDNGDYYYDNPFSNCNNPENLCPDHNQCELDPCYPGVPCRSSSVAPYFTCGPCPTGFSGDGITCDGLGCPVGFAGISGECAPDSDLDGYPDSELSCTEIYCRQDNCIYRPNSGQEDADGDGDGDACDSDADGDGFDKNTDNCLLISNPLQEDADSDGWGNVCDNCPSVSNPRQKDTDGDELGDECDDDIDNDGTDNVNDNCISTANANQNDLDGDGLGDECDNCPQHPNIGQEDADEDLLGDACDNDADLDSDGVDDSIDNCPDVANSDQSDVDGDGSGDACDADSDNDGVDDTADNCPLYPIQGVVSMLDLFGDEKVCLGHGMYEYRENFDGLLGSDEYDMSVELYCDENLGDNLEPEFVSFLQFGSHDKGNRVFPQLIILTSYAQGKQTPKVWFSQAERGLSKLINSTTGPGTALRDALWYTGSTPDQATLLWKDNSIGWAPNVAYRWQLHHRPRIGVIRFYLYRGDSQLIDSKNIYDTTLQGGRLGLFCFSQEKIIWSNIKYTCTDCKKSATSLSVTHHWLNIMYEVWSMV